MNNTQYFLLILIFGALVACTKQDKGLLKKNPAPSDYLFLQRAFPYETVPSQKYYEAMAWANSQASLRNDNQTHTIIKQ